ncbi:MAG: hypothetical protein R3F08_07985 [Dokdonella sp.]|nr:hypothetical protein [Dokdonella sp.]MCB1573240.1 hypothetical protein [Xanthomonadales bacterium]
MLGTSNNQTGEITMRMGLIIAGILLIAVGAAAFTGNLNFSKDKEVLKVGDFSATVKQEKTVPQWIGGIGALVGLGLVAAGAMRKG